MFRVEYSFRKHRYEIVEGGPLTLDEAERCRADKIKGLKRHTENHHRQKVGELHAFLAKTYETLTAAVENGEPDFYSGHDYQRLAETVAILVLRFGCTIAINEPSTPLEAMRLIGRLLAWCGGIIDRERPMKVSEVAERLNIGVKKVCSLIKSDRRTAADIARQQVAGDNLNCKAGPA